jgi:rhamnulokinase
VARVRFGDTALELEIVHRFPNGTRLRDGHERWDAKALLDGVLHGLRRAADGVALRSVGVDGWGVDYALLDARGRLLEDPIGYRDRRTQGAMEAIFARVPRAEIFGATGIQSLPINTLFQLYAHLRSGTWPPDAARVLLLPDWFHFELCGEAVAERTIASTTQLLGLDGRWCAPLFEKLGLPLSAMAPVVPAGTRLGRLRAEHGMGALDVVAPAAHDTASAVIGAPLERGVAYVSSGTWSLVGVEASEPCTSPAALAANATNEAGAFGTFRLLRNVTGLWILEGCRRAWQARGESVGDPASAPAASAFIDPDDARFLNPPDMLDAIRGYLEASDQPAPADPAAIARVVLESLALRYAAVLREIEALGGERLRAVAIVGGGSQNDFSSQATADAAGLPVLAGPVEATALGNAVVQAIADGRFRNVAEARAYLRRHLAVKRFEPAIGADERAALRARYARVTARTGE